MVANQEAFLDWAAKQDASTRSEGRPYFSEEEWNREASKFVGPIRHNPKNVNFRYSCEFWTPLGAVEYILKGKVRGLIDREHLVRWMKKAVAIEGGNVTDKFAFNILTFDVGGEPFYFWRSNEAMGAFKTYASEDWQAARQEKKEVYGRGKGWGGSHSDAGGCRTHRWAETGADSDPWGQYQWPQDYPPKGGKGRHWRD